MLNPNNRFPVAKKYCSSMLLMPVSNKPGFNCIFVYVKGEEKCFERYLRTVNLCNYLYLYYFFAFVFFTRLSMPSSNPSLQKSCFPFKCMHLGVGMGVGILNLLHINVSFKA